MNQYIAIIPARKGSKTIKNKNLIKIKNRKLIDFTIEAATKVKKINKIIISTNIKKILKKNTNRKIYIRRPEALSNDYASTESVILHAIKILKKKSIAPKNIVLLQPTSPFRTSQDILESIKLFEKGKYDSLFSAYEDKFLYWKKTKKNFAPINYNIKFRKRRQVSSKTIIENGAIFIFNFNKFLKSKVRLFGKIGCYIMSKKNSFEIDDKFDLHLARKI